MSAFDSVQGHEGPSLIAGGNHVDARGTISFVNAFDFKGVDRFYWITGSTVPRGWVGHRREHKWFCVVDGEVLVAVVQPDDWQHPRSDLRVLRYWLSVAQPRVLYVPPGFATASIHLDEHAVLMVFSSGKVEGAETDDFRFAVDYWPIGTR